VTYQPDITGVRAKIERAKEHVRDLELPISQFEQLIANGVVAYNEPDTGDRVFRVKIPYQPPLRWATIIGDAVHNLRSSLDILVAELVRGKGNPVTRHTGFPIYNSVDAFTDAFKSGYPAKVEGAPDEAVDLIKATKPYKGGNDALWYIHRLDIVDKHSLLIAVISRREGTVYDMSHHRVTWDSIHNPSRIAEAWKWWSLEHFDDYTGPLKEGAVIDRIPAQFRSHVDVDPQFAFRVSFGENEVVQGQAILPALYNYVNFVEGIVEPFLPLFSRDAS